MATNYDVFLSFRGSDLRGKFVDHLYSRLNLLKVNVFIDEIKLRKRDSVDESLNLVIQQSKIFVVVLSTGYANSAWCLDELVKIVNKKGHVVLPVFFHVSPGDVARQSGVYGEAFSRHEGEFTKERVSGWRKALTNVTKIRGFHFDREQSEATLVEDISTNIVQMLIDDKSTQTTNISFPTPPLHNYDVFVSFQGSEVRGRFVDYLYSRLKLLKVNTFMDHMMLPKGELIEESVNLVIQQSKTFVILLSPEYVNSPWCLDELVKVFEKEGHVVVPVFFHVSPRDVCNQDGVYGEAFWRHEKIFSKDRVKGWRKALNHVANTRGFCVTEQESEATLVKDMSTQLVRMLDDIAERPETETSSSTIKVVVDNLETSDDI